MANTPSPSAPLPGNRDQAMEGSPSGGPGNTSRESTLNLFVKYPREQGQWREELGKAHIAVGATRTLCQKNCRPDAPGNGGISARGWRFFSGRRLQEVTCQSCLAALQRSSVLASAGACASAHWATSGEQVGALLTRLETTSSLWQAHLWLALACSPLLTEQEVATYRQYRLFSPQQCLRLVHQLRDRGYDVPTRPLGLEEHLAP